MTILDHDPYTCANLREVVGELIVAQELDFLHDQEPTDVHAEHTCCSCCEWVRDVEASVAEDAAKIHAETAEEHEQTHHGQDV